MTEYRVLVDAERLTPELLAVLEEKGFEDETARYPTMPESILVLAAPGHELEDPGSARDDLVESGAGSAVLRPEAVNELLQSSDDAHISYILPPDETGRVGNSLFDIFPRLAGEETDETEAGTTPDESGDPPGTAATHVQKTGEDTKPQEGDTVKAQTDEASSPGDGEAAETPPITGAAALIEKGLAALESPGSLWQYLSADSKSELAPTHLNRLYEDRRWFSRRAAWTFAPEMELLDRAAAEDTLAEAVLREKVGITEEHRIEHQQRNEKAKKEVLLLGVQVALANERKSLEERRTALGGKTVEFAEEVITQMKKWRSLAEFGVAALFFALIFSMAAIAYVLLELVPADDVSGEGAALLVFVLAVFTAAPAVLLLLQRPLKGIDTFTPGGEAPAAEGGEGSADTAGTDDSTPSTDTPSSTAKATGSS